MHAAKHSVGNAVPIVCGTQHGQCGPQHTDAAMQCGQYGLICVLQRAMWTMRSAEHDADNAVLSICMLQSNADNAVLICTLQSVAWTMRSQSYAERDADNVVLSIRMLQSIVDNAVQGICVHDGAIMMCMLVCSVMVHE
jgi:hypothetical protein